MSAVYLEDVDKVENAVQDIELFQSRIGEMNYLALQASARDKKVRTVMMNLVKQNEALISEPLELFELDAIEAEAIEASKDKQIVHTAQRRGRGCERRRRQPRTF